MGKKHQPTSSIENHRGIEDLVVNSVALAFILQIDELLCSESPGKFEASSSRWMEIRGFQWDQNMIL